MLSPGDRVPDVHAWAAPREDAGSLKEVLGEGLSLQCFYVFDCTVELTHLRRNDNVPRV